MSELGAKSKLKIGQFGYSLDIISLNKRGPCYFDGVRYDVKAGSDIRKWAEVVVITKTPEPTVIETWGVFPLSYELEGGGFRAVGTKNSLPVTVATIYDDYKAISFTATEATYEIGTAASAADNTQPLFESKSLLFYATQNCLVRFNNSKRVQHFIPSGVYLTFNRRCTVIYVVRDTADGTLQVWAEG